jgi:MYXO-CTERM domain-containing protein
VQRLPNGNTLIAEGAYGEISEVTEAGDLVWYYVNPVLEDRALYWDEEIPSNSAGTIQQNEIFLARRYDASYEGLSGRALTPGDVLELGQSGPEQSGSACLGLAVLTLGFFRRRRDC